MGEEVDRSKATDSATASPRRHWVYLLSGLFVGGLFFYVTARNINFEEALTAIYAIKLIWLLPLTLIYVSNIVLRSFRWRFMFPDESRPSLRYSIDAFLVGKVGNNFMPGRLGELLRAGVIGRLLPSVGTSGALATIVIEKIFDALAVLLLLGIALLAAPLPLWLSRAGILMIAILPTMLLALWVLDRAGSRLSAASENGDVVDSGSELADRLRGLALGVFQKFSSGLYTLRNARHFALSSTLTLVIWSGEVIIMFLCFKAFSIPAPFMAAVVSMVFLSVGSILPSAPGFIGTYQLFIVAALQLYAVSSSSAFALSIFLNLYVIIMTSALGVLAIVLDGGLINFRQVFAAVSKNS